MQQIYFNNISTQFNKVGDDFIASQVGTFRNDSDLAKMIGIPELKEETSRNFSAGFVFNPFPALTITTDFYYILIDDRVILSGRISEGNEAIPQSVRDSVGHTAGSVLHECRGHYDQGSGRGRKL